MKYRKPKNSINSIHPNIGAKYNNELVWVKSVNEEEQTAEISMPTFEDPDKTVLLSQLIKM